MAGDDCASGSVDFYGGRVTNHAPGLRLMVELLNSPVVEDLKLFSLLLLHKISYSVRLYWERISKKCSTVIAESKVTKHFT